MTVRDEFAGRNFGVYADYFRMNTKISEVSR